MHCPLVREVTEKQRSWEDEERVRCNQVSLLAKTQGGPSQSKTSARACSTAACLQEKLREERDKARDKKLHYQLQLGEEQVLPTHMPHS